MPTLTVGDPAPWFLPPSLANLEAHHDTMIGGYRAVLFFFGSSSNPLVQPVWRDFLAAQERFAARQITVFGVSIDRQDAPFASTLDPSAPVKMLLDVQGELSIQYGVCQLAADGGIAYDPTTFVLDENLQVVAVIPLETRGHLDRLLEVIERWPAPAPARTIRQQAPALLISNVLQPDFCRYLIQRYEADGGTESGFMKQEQGKTAIELNYGVKRRRDLLITEPELLNQINTLIGRRVVPEVFKAFQFRITGYERYTIGCYEAHNQGFFQPHRDNVSVGSAHRRFAMTINLNTSEYEGGGLRFPEYGSDLYVPDAGSAVIFSCSLLHEVTPVTQGRRFALLSFFFDEEGAKLREQTMHQIVRDAPPQAASRPDRPPQKTHKSVGFQPKRGK